MAASRKPEPPQKADALGDGIEFEFEGETYVVPPPSKWPLEATEHLEQGMIVTFTRMVLGEAQYRHFRDAKERTVGDLEALNDAMAKAAGLGN